ncbi:ribonuclease H protein [Artemisia annua]|uniref:Ribonuclease H protein n=1 Tax=Artemisia annua TaxID=35608 RepID=A0A2U1QAA1_ARTAN|nr:ribonuclease H protein [Artemisia annua]
MASRDFGGLGVGSIRSKNLSLLGKWRWRFLVEKEAIWKKVISKFHGVDGGFSNTAGTGLKKPSRKWCLMVMEVVAGCFKQKRRKKTKLREEPK